MDFLKGFDIEKALDFEKVAGSVAGSLSALDQYPDRKAAASEARVNVTSAGECMGSLQRTCRAGKGFQQGCYALAHAGASKARQTYAAWNDLDLEVR